MSFGFNDFYFQKIDNFMGLKTGADYETAKNELWKEYKELFWYKHAQGYMPETGINRNGIPGGKHCNPSFDKWCPWLVGGCKRYGKGLFTDTRMSMEFSRAYRCDHCKADFPKGELEHGGQRKTKKTSISKSNDNSQMSLLDLQ